METNPFEIVFYQIADDSLLKKHRQDDTGWDWGWADWQREWMDNTPNRFAYRCLPLTIVNQTGWWVNNPVSFSATWNGRKEPGNILFRFDTAADTWGPWINSQFGEGIITWNTPFLIRTKPKGSRLLVMGPPNYFKTNAHPLTALIESDWMTMSFTMNWKLMIPNMAVRFEAGEPLFQVMPLASNVCSDLENASVSYMKLSDDAEVTKAYHEWHISRKEFHEMKARGEVKPDDWQKDYFQGRDMTGRQVAYEHRTKVKAPPIRYPSGLVETPVKKDARPMSSAQPPSRPENSAARRGPEPRRAEENPRAATAVGVQEPIWETQQIVLQASAQEAAAPARQARPVAPVTSGLVNDDWRRWIAENLMLDAPPDNLVRLMGEQGIPIHEALDEVNAAIKSPYVRATERLRNRLKKREWLLSTYRKLNRLHPKSNEVERRHKISRQDFLNEYYTTNRPVIITGMMEDWPAMHKWNLDYFEHKFGDREIEVQAGRKAGDNYEVEREKYATKMRVSEYVQKIRSAGVTNDFYLTANNNSLNKSALPELWDDIRQIPEYLDGSDRMNGFFWFGPAGTITPFHHDLTNNFMAQVVGSKRIKLVPSWDLPFMRNQLHCFSNVDGRVLPAASQPPLTEPQVYDCVIGPGEILFLPIGCLHFVEGLEVSVTVSFTNFVFDNDFSSFYSTYHGV